MDSSPDIKTSLLTIEGDTIRVPSHGNLFNDIDDAFRSLDHTIGDELFIFIYKRGQQFRFIAEHWTMEQSAVTLIKYDLNGVRYARLKRYGTEETHASLLKTGYDCLGATWYIDYEGYVDIFIKNLEYWHKNNPEKIVQKKQLPKTGF
jgi:hypothetical protein